jgi:hypothetical protein
MSGRAMLPLSLSAAILVAARAAAIPGVGGLLMAANRPSVDRRISARYGHQHFLEAIRLGGPPTQSRYGASRVNP